MHEAPRSCLLAPRLVGEIGMLSTNKNRTRWDINAYADLICEEFSWRTTHAMIKICLGSKSGEKRTQADKGMCGGFFRCNEQLTESQMCMEGHAVGMYKGGM